MGSIISFVVLCLLNLCTLRAAELATSYKPVDPLINGDDMFYSCSDVKFWEAQNRIAQSIGLEPSVGKCYISRHCASMNSVAFHRDRNGFLKRVDYLPVGLLHGKHKVAGELDCGDDDEFELSRESLSGCLKLVQEGSVNPYRTTCRFLSYNSKALNQELKGRNIFLPYWLGGGGQIPPRGFKVYVTEAQRLLANRRIMRIRESPNAKLTHSVGCLNSFDSDLERPSDVVNHWTVDVDIESKDVFFEERGNSGTRYFPVAVRTKLAFRPCFTQQPSKGAASGCVDQKTQNGVRKALNTSVPSTIQRSTYHQWGSLDEAEATLTTASCWKIVVNAVEFTCLCGGPLCGYCGASRDCTGLPRLARFDVMYSPRVLGRGSLPNNEREERPKGEGRQEESRLDDSDRRKQTITPT